MIHVVVCPSLQFFASVVYPSINDCVWTTKAEWCVHLLLRRLRNFAVIAHVDHGKTTLMDQLMKACGVSSATERFMDSNTLEKERGITISSKYTSMLWGDNVLNAVDTPGHADFGGEVER